MGALADLTGAPEADVLPGYVLSPLELSDFGQLEVKFELTCQARAVALANLLPPALGDLHVQRAERAIREGDLAWGGWGFDAELLKVQHAPDILRLAVAHQHPDVTPEKAVELWRASKKQEALHARLLDLAGYPRRRRDRGKEARTDGGSQSASAKSSGSSASTGSEAPPSPGATSPA